MRLFFIGVKVRDRLLAILQAFDLLLDRVLPQRARPLAKSLD